MDSPETLVNDPGAHSSQLVLAELDAPGKPYDPVWHSMPSQKFAPFELENDPDLQSKQVLVAPDPVAYVPA